MIECKTDNKIIEEIYEKYYEELKKYINNKIDNKYDTPDLIQFIYLKMKEMENDKINKLYEENELEYWMMGVAKKQLFNKDSDFNKYIKSISNYTEISDNIHSEKNPINLKEFIINEYLKDKKDLWIQLYKLYKINKRKIIYHKDKTYDWDELMNVKNNTEIIHNITQINLYIGLRLFSILTSKNSKTLILQDLKKILNMEVKDIKIKFDEIEDVIIHISECERCKKPYKDKMSEELNNIDNSVDID